MRVVVVVAAAAAAAVVIVAVVVILLVMILVVVLVMVVVVLSSLLFIGGLSWLRAHFLTCTCLPWFQPPEHKLARMMLSDLVIAVAATFFFGPPKMLLE